MPANTFRTRYSPTDRLFEVVSWILLLILWVAAIDTYLEAEELIPVQFKFSGIITKFGDRITLLFYPLTATIMLSGLTYLSRNTKVYASQTPLTPESIRLIQWLKIALPVSFLLVTLFIRVMTLSGPIHHGNLVFPVALAIVCLPPTYYIYKTLLIKKIV